MLTSATVLPVLMVTGMQTMNNIQQAAKQDKQDKMVGNIVGYLEERSVDMPDDVLREIANYVYAESKEHDIDYRLVLAVMKVESNFKLDAVSPKGARGLLQIKPSLGRGIAETLGVTWTGDRTLHEPEKNIKFGVYHLSQLIEDFETLPWALYAYNSGSTKARKLAAQQKRPGLRFAKAVLNEYEKTITALPEPQ
jgi:soluble lytic murein transglycosylase